MNTTFVLRSPLPAVAQLLDWWRRLDRLHKLAAALSIFVVGGVVYSCSLLEGYIEEAFASKAAAKTALYMDSFIEPHVQALASHPSLSAETRATLERLLSPASIGKPVIAFRIWVGDRIVFSSRSELIGKNFHPSPARNSASHGHVVASFGPDSEDEEYERSLGVPILEVYAPIRRAGTQHIIAIAETAELASELTSHIRAAQYTSYAVIITFATAVLLVFFGLGNGLQRTNGRVIEVEDFSARVYAASTYLLECSDRDRRNLCEQLHSGPLQQAAFALLRVDELRTTGEHSDQDIEVVSKALETCVGQLHALSGRFPLELTEVPLAGALSMAISQHVLKHAVVVSSAFTDLPHDLPYALKACLFKFLEECLADAAQSMRGTEITVYGRSRNGLLELELSYEAGPDAPAWVTSNLTGQRQTLQHRIQALGGSLSFRSLPPGRVSITVSLMLLKNSVSVT